MSITGAVAELNKEIERLTKIRDSLLQGASVPGTIATVPAKRPEPQKKSAGLTTAVAAKKSVPAKKRVMSAAAKKKISSIPRPHRPPSFVYLGRDGSCSISLNIRYPQVCADISVKRNPLPVRR